MTARWTSVPHDGKIFRVAIRRLVILATIVTGILALLAIFAPWWFYPGTNEYWSLRMEPWPRSERFFDASQHANRKRKTDEDKAADDRDGTGCDDRRVVIPSAERQARTNKHDPGRGDNRTQNQQKRIHTPVPPKDARRP